MSVQIKILLLKDIFLRKRFLKSLLVPWVPSIIFRKLWGLTQATFPSSCSIYSYDLCSLTVAIISFFLFFFSSHHFLPFPRTCHSHSPLSRWVPVPTDHNVPLLGKTPFISLGSEQVNFLITCDSDLSGRVCHLDLFVSWVPCLWHTYHIVPGLSVRVCDYLCWKHWLVNFEFPILYTVPGTK